MKLQQKAMVRHKTAQGGDRKAALDMPNRLSMRALEHAPCMALHGLIVTASDCALVPNE